MNDDHRIINKLQQQLNRIDIEKDARHCDNDINIKGSKSVNYFRTIANSLFGSITSYDDVKAKLEKEIDELVPSYDLVCT
jgi:hypothetical protein